MWDIERAKSSQENPSHRHLAKQVAMTDFVKKQNQNQNKTSCLGAWEPSSGSSLKTTFSLVTPLLGGGRMERGSVTSCSLNTTSQLYISPSRIHLLDFLANHGHLWPQTGVVRLLAGLLCKDSLNSLGREL